MSGTTWKKKSRQGLPEERKVGEKFSVKPIGGDDGDGDCDCGGDGLVVVRLNLATIRSMKGLEGVAAVAAAAFWWGCDLRL